MEENSDKGWLQELPLFVGEVTGHDEKSFPAGNRSGSSDDSKTTVVLASVPMFSGQGSPMYTWTVSSVIFIGIETRKLVPIGAVIMQAKVALI